MMKRSAFLFFLLILLLFILSIPLAIGAWLEPKLEHQLTYLFNAPVTMKALSVNPLTGEVRAKRLTFQNSKSFPDHVHLDAEGGVSLKMNLMALKGKRVLIDHVIFKDLRYYIDRKTEPPPGEARTNITAWWRNIKKIRANKASREAALAPKPRSPGWEVWIKRIEIQNGFLAIEDTSNGMLVRKWIFQKFKGVMTGFHWPAGDPSQLDQHVRFEGLFGEQEPGPFWIEGNGNFPTGGISFDLYGEVLDGGLKDHEMIWEGLPIDIPKGRYQLKIHAVCDKKAFRAQNELVIKDMQTKVGPKAADKILGLPVKAWITFLENEKELRLNIPVEGHITDPAFEYNKAFRKAFQESLKAKVQVGVQFVAGSAAKIATEATDLSVKVKDGIGTGLGKITSTIQGQEEKNE